MCRGEQSLNAARSALSPEAGKQHEGQLEKSPSQGKDGQPGIGPSVRGMFSDLKRTMERVGELAKDTIARHHILARGYGMSQIFSCFQDCA